jgi:5-methylcytosine-specific restriction enzyme subunit McrC
MQIHSETLDLQEYETSSPIELGDGILAALRTIPSDRIAVLATERQGVYVVRASSWIGSVVLPGLTIRIRPKVPDLRNVLMMFSAGTGLASWAREEVRYGVDDLVDGLAELVLREVDAATRRGLVRGYQLEESRVPTIRGRLMVEELAVRPWDLFPAPCEFASFAGDIPENRVLKAVLSLVLGWALDPALRRHAMLILNRLDEASDSGAPLLELQRIRISPVNAHYEVALNIGRLVLEGVGLSHLAGGATAHSFLVNMNQLFERWVGAEISGRLWPGVEVIEQANVPLSTRPSVPMAPDLLFKTAGRVGFVADIKYKLTSTGLSRNADYYQLLAYVTALRLNTGLLIYCQADDAPPREIEVEGGGQRLRCHPLSLAGSPEDVAAAVDELSVAISAWAEADRVSTRTSDGAPRF